MIPSPLPRKPRKSRESRALGKAAGLISESCEKPGLRAFLLGCIFLLIMSAYWWNFEQRLAKIQPPDGSHRVVNEDDILDKEQLRLLHAWRTRFQKEWNVQLLVQVSAGSLQLPPYPASTLYVGTGLEHAEAVIAVPPLVRKALGEGVRIEAEEGLALCIKKATPIIEYTTHSHGAEQDNISPEQTAEQASAQIAAAGAATLHCLDATLQHIWDAL